MKSNLRKIGDFIRQVNVRNDEGNIELLLGVNLDKVFIPSVANTNGTDMTKYKVIKKGQFGCKLMSVGRDKKLPISRLVDHEKALISSAYYVFEVSDGSILNPEYLMMWFSRSESDRYLWFQSGGDVRGRITWDDLCDLPIKVPSIEKQNEIVKEYNTVVNRIKLNEQLNQKLEETAQALYKHWFVDFEFPNTEGKPYKSSGGEMVYNEELDKEIPVGWEVSNLGRYSKVKSGFAFKSSLWCGNGIPVIKIGSINNNTIAYDSLAFVENQIDKAHKSKCKKGSIVIAMTGATIGKLGLVPELLPFAYVNQRVGLFDTGFSKSPYLYLMLLSDYVQNEIKNVGGDSAQANISSSQIESIRIVYSDRKIIEEFNLKSIGLFKRLLTNVFNIKKLREIKEILLSKMTKVDLKKELIN